MLSISSIKPQVYSLFNDNLNSGYVFNENCLCKDKGMENNVGVLIRERLKSMNKTQVWLADKCFVSNNAVTKWIRSGQLSRENAIKVADALMISVDRLLGSDRLTVDNELERQLLMFFRGMSHDHQDDVLRISNSLYDIDKPTGTKSSPYPHFKKSKST